MAEEITGEERETMRGRMTAVSIYTLVILILPLAAEAKIDPATAVGVWLFDEPNVAVVKDLSGNGNDGIVRVPPKWIDGPFGKAVEFSGSGQMIEVPDSESLNFGDKQSFTVVVWFKFSQPQDWNRLVRERNPSPWGSGNYGWELQTQGLRIHWSLDDSAGNHVKTTYENAGTGEWRHTAMVVDRENKVMITYLDGDNERRVNIDNIGSVTGNLPVVIGGGIIGAIDEVGIFRAVLSQEDIVQIMKEGLEEVLKGLAVSPPGKLAAPWGRIKAGR